MPLINKSLFILTLLCSVSCSFMSSPRVLSVTPDHLENLFTTNVVISIEFSKDMDRESVEQAFSLFLSYDRGNKLEGDFSWTGDTMMHFTPQLNGLEYPAEYVINLPASALDQDGNGLDGTFFSTFSLLSNLARPRVIATTPLNASTNFSIYSNVIITFSLNMATNETRQAFSISPNIQGNVNIYSNTLVFSPDSPFQNGVYYTVNLAASARATNSVTLLNDLEFYFLPGQDFTIPRLLSVRTNLYTFNMTNHQSLIEKLSTNLVLVFNTDMDRSSLEQGLTIEPTINHYISWISNNIAQINMLDAMLPSTNYTLTFDKSIKSTYGRSLLQEDKFDFTTDGDYSRLVIFLEALEGTNSNYFLPETINFFQLGSNNTMSLIVSFSSLSLTNLDWISVFNNTDLEYISGENGLKQGEISDIIPLNSNTNQFSFILDQLAISNFYKITFKGGPDGIQDVLHNHLDQTIELYFTATN